MDRLSCIADVATPSFSLTISLRLFTSENTLVNFHVPEVSRILPWNLSGFLKSAMFLKPIFNPCGSNIFYYSFLSYIFA
ncbi:hypothetical protein M413DRAFT_85574 [Hebeloma cylindrosporum]|uniref:Uncharacterized protein n=1 Tax=Hebeloma cylindrosporum TaxID=76867 RepID=A0A0C2YGB2_HEBCY|nr:hypothetical protein M413DRAFT_85574 [Hebeloma cylindrosporum h7]